MPTTYYKENSQSDFENGELDSVVATADGLELVSSSTVDEISDTTNLSYSSFTSITQVIITKMIIYLTKVHYKVREDGSHTLSIATSHGGNPIYQQTVTTNVGEGNFYTFILSEIVLLVNDTTYYFTIEMPSGKFYHILSDYDGIMWSSGGLYIQNEDLAINRTLGFGITYLDNYIFIGNRIIIPQDLTTLSINPDLKIQWVATEPENTDIIVETAVKGETNYTDENIGTGNLVVNTTDITTINDNGVYQNNITGSSITDPLQLINNNLGDRAYNSDTNGYFQIDFGTGYYAKSAYAVYKYKLYARNSSSYYKQTPKDITFAGSNNGSDWTTLDTYTWTVTAAGQTIERTFSNTISYRYYRLSYTSNNGIAGVTALAEWKMFDNEIENIFYLPTYPAERHDDVVISVDGTPTTEFTRTNINDPSEIIFNVGHEPGDGLAVTASFTGIAKPSETAEVQTLYLGGATGGTYDLGISGNMITIAYNDNAEAIQTVLETIFGVNGVTVESGTDYIITFNTIIRDSSLVADFTNLIGATDPTLTKTTSYSAGDWEIQTSGESITNIPTGDLTGKHLWIRQTLETTNINSAPILEEVEVYYYDASGQLVCVCFI